MTQMNHKKQIQHLLVLFAIFSSVVTFAGIFINIYIWNNNQSLTEVGIYNLIFFLFIFLGTLMGVYIIKTRNSMANYMVATVFLCLTFGLTLIAENIDLFPPFIGGPLGFSIGLFYIGFNIYALIVPQPANRVYLLSMEEVLSRTTALVIPLLSSVVIVLLGYGSMFALIFLLVISISLLSFKTPRYTSDFQQKKMKNRPFRKKYMSVFFSLIGFGFLNGLIGLSSSVLVYAKLSNEIFLGVFNTLLASLGIFGAYILGKKLVHHSSQKYVLAGALLHSLAILFLFSDHILLLLLFNLCMAIALPLLWIPVNIAHFNEIKRLACFDENTCDLSLLSCYLLVREFLLTLGRLIFFTIIAIHGEATFDHPSFFVIVGISFLVPIVIYLGNYKWFYDRSDVHPE